MGETDDRLDMTPRRLALGSIVLLAMVLIVPDVAFVLTSPHGRKLSWVAGQLVLPTMLLMAYFAVLGRWPRLACLLMVPFAVLAPTATFYILDYRTPITEAVLGTLLATNVAEATDFLGPGMWMLVALSLAAGALAVIAARLSARARLHLIASRRVHGTVVALAAIPVFAFLGTQAVAQRPAGVGIAAGEGPGSHLFRAVRDSYPFGIPLTLGLWWKDQARLQAAMRRTQGFRFHAVHTARTGQRQIYVLVIGESSRRNHWQLFGYDRPTNPELSHTDDLVPVTHMISPWPTTIGAVPAMLTRKPATMGLFQPFTERSIVTLMREAGFDTWWLSNQSPTGEWNSPITAYADEAQHLQWLNLQRYDGSLPEGLGQAVRQSRGDLFVVLHMIGSHGSYDLRYPPAFKTFTPTLRDGGPSASRYRRVTNSYDNTIVYTDHVLARTIAELRQTGAIAALWYQSDHGETLPTATCRMSEHGHGYRYEFPVPALFWYSDAYAQAFPEKLAALRAHAGDRASSANTFATLADMAGVHFAGQDSSRSLFSTTWHYRPRIVHPVWQAEHGWVDYDRAELGDGCELVRPRPKAATSK